MTLSKIQRELLCNLIYDNNVDYYSQNTFSALMRRNLINDSLSLTKIGYKKALELIPLDHQCEFLKLKLSERIVITLANPELQTFYWYKENHYNGAYCEGGALLTIIKALALDKLTELNLFNSRKDACTRFLEAQLTILKDHKFEILESIYEISEDQFLDNFSEILEFRLIQDVYPGLTTQFAEHFFQAMDRKIIVSITNKFFESPYAFRKGWPDLTLVKNNEIKFVEVKTNDRLHQSQINILTEFREIIPASFEVVKLKTYN
jgi:hypothetical protein